MTGVLCCKDWKNILRLRYQRYVKQFGYIVWVETFLGAACLCGAQHNRVVIHEWVFSAALVQTCKNINTLESPRFFCLHPAEMSLCGFLYVVITEVCQITDALCTFPKL